MCFEKPLSGKMISVEYEFTWEGRKWRIPAVYVEAERLNVEFCIMIPREELESFFGKWTHEKRVSAIKNGEIEVLSLDDPFALIYQPEIEINGRRLMLSRCGTIPWYPHGIEGVEEVESDWQAEERMRACHCDRKQGWLFMSAEYRCRADEVLPIETLAIGLKAEKRTISGDMFNTQAKEEDRNYSFIHPVTGINHEFHIHRCEQQQLADDMLPKGGKHKRLRHYQALTYSLNPPLKDEEFRISDCSQGDMANGSMSVIVLSDQVSDTKEKTMCSSMYERPVEHVTWRMYFKVQQEKDMPFVEINICNN